MNDETKLHDLPNSEVDSRSSELGRRVSAAGYDETPRGLINKWNCWDITVGEFSLCLANNETP